MDKVQPWGIIAKTDHNEYQNQVVAQARKLKADLPPKGQIKDSEEAYKGYFEMPTSDAKDITRRIIQKLGHNKVLFQNLVWLEDPTRPCCVKEILKIFHVKGFLDQNSEFSIPIYIMSAYTDT